jgi:hypothetical protein
MKVRPTEMKVRSTKDQTLFTGIETYCLTEDEIFVGKFKNAKQIDSLIEVGAIQMVTPEADIIKPVPVILLGEDGKELPLTSVPHPKNFLPYMSPELDPLAILDKATGKMISVKDRTEPYSLEEMNAMLAR